MTPPSPSYKIIGLVGLKGSGKDTAADALIDRGYTRVRFAGALKAMMRALFSYAGSTPKAIDNYLECVECKEAANLYLCGQSPRHAMQTLGTEWGRDLIGEDLWVRLCMARCSAVWPAVISDVRYPNEIAAIKAAGGFTIRIDRGTPPLKYEHSSENIYDLTVDVAISNNGTIAELHQKVLAAIKGQNNEQ